MAMTISRNQLLRGKIIAVEAQHGHDGFVIIRLDDGQTITGTFSRRKLITVYGGTLVVRTPTPEERVRFKKRKQVRVILSQTRPGTAEIWDIDPQEDASSTSATSR